MFVIKCKSFLLCILIPVAVGLLAGLLTMSDFGIYKTLQLPPGAPPSWAFPVVWTLLYILMGIASYGVFSAKEGNITGAFWVYALQLALNFFWPILFFKTQLYLLSFFWLLLLIAAILLTTKLFYRINKLSAYLMIPYLLWCLYASYLNLGVIILN